MWLWVKPHGGCRVVLVGEARKRVIYSMLSKSTQAAWSVFKGDLDKHMAHGHTTDD